MTRRFLHDRVTRITTKKDHTNTPALKRRKKSSELYQLAVMGLLCWKQAFCLVHKDRVPILAVGERLSDEASKVRNLWSGGSTRQLPIHIANLTRTCVTRLFSEKIVTKKNCARKMSMWCYVTGRCNKEKSIKSVEIQNNRRRQWIFSVHCIKIRFVAVYNGVVSWITEPFVR